MKDSRQELAAGTANQNFAWIAAAGLIAEFSERPIAVLDGSGRVRLINRAMERLLRCPPNAAVGLEWVTAFTLPLAATPAARALDEALRGLSTTAEMPIVACDQEQLLLSLELRRVGPDAEPGVLLVVTSSRVVAAPAHCPRNQMSYEISIAPSDFGLLSPTEGAVGRGAEREFCYASLFQRPTYCAGCPARDLVAVGESRTMVQHRARPNNEYLLIRATKLAAFKARVVVRFVQHEEVRLVIRARVDFLAASAGLSKREHDVLVALALSGESLGAIAAALGITLGTIKFHVNNVLKKLGADSRVDLQRLLL